MRAALVALTVTAVIAVALLLQDVLDSAIAAWIGFGAVFVLCIGWTLGLLPGGGADGGD